MKSYDIILSSTQLNDIRPLFKIPIKNSRDITNSKSCDTSFEVMFSTVGRIYKILADVTYINNTTCRITYTGAPTINIDEALQWAIIDDYFVIFVKNIFTQCEIYCNITGSRLSTSIILMNGQFIDISNLTLTNGENLNILAKGNYANNYFYAKETKETTTSHLIPGFTTTSKSYFNIYCRTSAGSKSIYEGCIVNNHIYYDNITSNNNLTLELNSTNGTLDITTQTTFAFLKVEIKTNI